MNSVPYKPAVLLFHGRGLISTLIRWQTRAKYSHAALLLPSGEILESWGGDGVRIKTLSDWEGIDIFHVDSMGSYEWDLAIDFARRQLGKKYDYRAVVRFLSREKMPSNSRWFCSELVFASLLAANVRLLERIDAALVSPGHLALSPRLIKYTE